MTFSSIMDSNSYNPATATLKPETTALIERRQRNLGPAYRLFYRNPLHLVRGEGTYLYDADGVRYLDAYNNVASIGHCHPRVVQAVTEQMSTLNTHTRYVHDAIVNYSDRLLATFPEEISSVMFTCTGSESNDLALRVAEEYTGGKGVIITSEAYHGNSGLTTAISPALGPAITLPPYVRTIPSPNATALGVTDIGVWFAEQVEAAIKDLAEHGYPISSLLIDTIFSSDGIFPDPKTLGLAVEKIHQAGGVVIADEVQPGFGRTGTGMWGFARHGFVPDLVTMGKPMGNGIPISAMAARPEVLAPFAKNMPYFNTFGGNPVSIAAANAVLSVIEDEGLIANAARSGEALLDGFEKLAKNYPVIGDARGIGLYLGVDIIDPHTGAPNQTLAQYIINELREKQILISLCGKDGNILKVRPPLVFSPENAEHLISTVDSVLAKAE